MIPIAGLKISLFVLVTFMGLVIADALKETQWFSHKLHVNSTIDLIEFFLVCGLPLILIITKLFLNRLSAKIKLMEDIDWLRDTLLRQKKSAEKKGKSYIQISSEEAEHISQIEETLIQKNRIKSIRSSRHDRMAEGYTLFKLPMVRDQIGELNPSQRLSVEMQLQDLAYSPTPKAAKRDRSNGEWTLPVPDASMEVIYTVIENKRQIRILSLQPLSGDSPAAQQPERSEDV